MNCSLAVVCIGVQEPPAGLLLVAHWWVAQRLGLRGAAKPHSYPRYLHHIHTCDRLSVLMRIAEAPRIRIEAR